MIGANDHGDLIQYPLDQQEVIIYLLYIIYAKGTKKDRYLCVEENESRITMILLFVADSGRIMDETSIHYGKFLIIAYSHDSIICCLRIKRDQNL